MEVDLESLNHGSKERNNESVSPLGPDLVRQLQEWNEITDFPVSTLHGLFEGAVEKYAEKTAVVYGEESLSYRELNDKANQVADYLISQGVQAGSFVGICMDRSLDMMVGLLGILKAGGAYVPLDPHYPAARLEHMLEDSAVSVLLTQRDCVEDLPPCRAQVLCLDGDATKLSDCSRENPDPRTKPDELAYLIYTSGSTGKPKGCQLTHANATRLFGATRHWFKFNENDVWTMFHSYAFDFSVWEIWGALLHGGKLVVVPYMVSRSPEQFYQLLIDQQVTVLNQTPSAFKQLIPVDRRPDELSLRTVVFGGEALDFAALKPWYERHADDEPQLVNMYGITETTVHVTYYPIHSRYVEQESSVIGIPIPDLQVWILDQETKPVAAGTAGEMCIAGAGLGRGYLNRQELTDAKFTTVDLFGTPTRVYRSGDLGRWLPDGQLEYLGRMDQQVQLRGFRIELGEIEAALNAHEFVQDSAVTLIDQDSNPRLAAYLILKPGSRQSGQPIARLMRSWLMERLPDYMVPSFFTVMELFPLTPTGKLDRKALPKPSLDEFIVGDDDIAYASETEKQLAAIWAELLELKRVPRQVDFFELGATSLMAATLFLRIQQQFDRDMTLAVLLQASTVESLAKRIELGEGGDELAGFRSLKLIQQGDPSVIPLYLVHGGDGHVLVFKDFADNLGPDQPVYAFQWPGMDGGRGADRIEEMARAYKKELLAFHSEGPLRLGGYCSGGIVAMELARLLRADGIEVIDPLLMVGTPYCRAQSHVRGEPEKDEQSRAVFDRMVEDMRSRKIVEEAEVPWEYSREAAMDGTLGKLKQTALYDMARRWRTQARLSRISRHAESGRRIPPEERPWYCGQSVIAAMLRYRYPLYEGDILYFRTGVCHGSAMGLSGWWDSPYMGVEELCGGTFDGYVVGGAHEDIFKWPEVANIVKSRIGE